MFWIEGCGYACWHYIIDTYHMSVSFNTKYAPYDDVGFC